jgi:K+-transporting ATPase ATPase C chain
VIAHFRASAALILATALICAVLYPLLLWGIGAALLPDRARGSLIVQDGKVIGSRQIGQAFAGEDYFWPRPSAAGAGYDGGTSSGSNWGANNPKLRDRAAQQLGPIIRFRKDGPRKGELAGPDIEKWALENPERIKVWAETYSVAVANWAKTDFKDDKYGLQGEFILQWAKDHPDITAEWRKVNPPKNDEPKPEDLAALFFSSYVRAHPGTWPGVVEEKQGNETVKVINPVTSDPVIQANFFDMWLQEHPRADLEPVPADMVTASGSGLDPHITVRNALSVYQLGRVAAKRAKTESEIQRVRQQITELIESQSFRPLGPLAGEPLVNVLELNLALDAKFPMRR